MDVATLQGRKRPASSALDSELLSAMVASVKSVQVQAYIDQRPKISIAANRKTFVGQMEESVWRYGEACVALWTPPTLTLVGPDGVSRISTEFSAMYPPIATDAGTSALAVTIDGSTCLLTLRERTVDRTPLSFPATWNYLGRGADGAVYSKEDADEGTRIISIHPQSAPTSKVILNRNLSEIETPTYREISRRVGGGSEPRGILQLPPRRKSTDCHPVIIWAYPDSTPSPKGWTCRLNSQFSVWFPLQYLLTRGFAVFYAPLPTRNRPLEPMERVVSALVPWLDTLAEQPEVMPNQFAFFGHSNGGYVSLALEALSRRFKAIVAYATFPDLAGSILSTGMDKVALDCAGRVLQADRFYYEDPEQPYAIGTPFWEDEAKWERNSPLFSVKNGNTPLLLIEGEFDAAPRQMEAVYSILYGRGIPVELAYYWGEGHVLASPGNIKDMWERTEKFLKTHLDPFALAR